MTCILCNSKNNYTIVKEYNDFILAFDNFPIIYSHLLLIPRNHVLSYREINKDLYVNCLQNLVSFWTGKGMSCMIYEHGNIEENKTENISIDHAHIHVIGFAKDAQGVKKLFDSIPDPNLTVFNTYEEAMDNNLLELPYHIFSYNMEHTALSYQALASQFFRCIFSKLFSSGNWNWKNNEMLFKEYKEKNKVRMNKLRLELSDYLKK